MDDVFRFLTGRDAWSVAGSRRGISVSDFHFCLPQQGYDLVRFVSVHWHLQLFHPSSGKIEGKTPQRLDSARFPYTVTFAFSTKTCRQTSRPTAFHPLHSLLLPNISEQSQNRTARAMMLHLFDSSIAESRLKTYKQTASEPKGGQVGYRKNPGRTEGRKRPT